MNNKLLIIIACLVTLGVGMYFIRHRSVSLTKESTMQERTFAMIKPDAVAAGNSDAIIEMIKENGFSIIQQQQLQLTKEKAEEFYAVHKERPFFQELVTFITSGPVIALALEKENAIKAWRHLMGATDPAQAEEGTIRKRFGTSIGTNATHGSDASETALQELNLFFPEL